MLHVLKRLPMGDLRTVFPAKPIPLHAMISSAGYCEERNHAYDWHGLRRGNSEFVLFQWTVSGRGMLECDGRVWDLLPNHAMILRIPHDHRYRLPKSSPHWTFVYLCLHGSEIWRIFGECISAAGPVHVMPPECGPVQAALGIYESAAKGGLATPFACSSLAYDFAMRLASHFLTPARQSARFAAVRAFVEEGLAEELNVAAMADAAGLSRYHFTREFTASEGISPGEFLLHARIRAATRLLAAGELSVKEVGAHCGFRSANYMSKAFRRILGVSPRDFRRSGMYSPLRPDDKG